MRIILPLQNPNVSWLRSVARVSIWWIAISWSGTRSGPVRGELRYDDIVSKRHPGTGEWLLKGREFRHWMKHDRNSIFWCSGIRKSLFD